jgi:hypothetical protein
MPPEALLADYPPPHQEIANRLRSVVLDAIPDAIERVRPGWRLIGYDLPVRGRGAMFAWIWLEPEHVHLGFPQGVLMDDARGLMKGAGITKLARWLTYAPGDSIDVEVARVLVEEAARTRLIPRSLQ